MFESEAKNGHRGVFELLHLSEKASSAGMASLAPREFPLYYGGKELKPFQYALFLLSKVCMTHMLQLLPPQHTSATIQRPYHVAELRDHLPARCT